MSNPDFRGPPGTPYRKPPPKLLQRGAYRAWLATIIVIVVLIIGGAMYWSGDFPYTATTTTGQSAAPHPATEPLTPETMPSPTPAPPDKR